MGNGTVYCMHDGCMVGRAAGKLTSEVRQNEDPEDSCHFSSESVCSLKKML